MEWWENWKLFFGGGAGVKKILNQPPKKVSSKSHGMEREKIWGGGGIKKFFDPPPKKKKNVFHFLTIPLDFEEKFLKKNFWKGGVKKTKGGWTKINYFEISRNFTNPNWQVRLGGQNSLKTQWKVVKKIFTWNSVIHWVFSENVVNFCYFCYFSSKSSNDPRKVRHYKKLYNFLHIPK